MLSKVNQMPSLLLCYSALWSKYLDSPNMVTLPNRKRKSIRKPCQSSNYKLIRIILTSIHFSSSDIAYRRIMCKSLAVFLWNAWGGRGGSQIYWVKNRIPLVSKQKNLYIGTSRNYISVVDNYCKLCYITFPLSIGMEISISRQPTHWNPHTS